MQTEPQSARGRNPHAKPLCGLHPNFLHFYVPHPSLDPSFAPFLSNLIFLPIPSVKAGTASGAPDCFHSVRMSPGPDALVSCLECSSCILFHLSYRYLSLGSFGVCYSTVPSSCHRCQVHPYYEQCGRSNLQCFSFDAGLTKKRSTHNAQRWVHFLALVVGSVSVTRYLFKIPLQYKPARCKDPIMPSPSAFHSSSISFAIAISQP